MEVLVPIEGDMRQPAPPKWLWTVAQGSLTRGEDLMATSTFLPKGLFLYALQVFAVFLLKHYRLGSLLGLSITDGFGTGHIGCLN